MSNGTLRSIAAIFRRLCFSVRLDLKDSKLRVWKERPRRGAQKTYLVYLQDIVAIICRLSCECSVFLRHGKEFSASSVEQQLETKISPMLANLTVSLLEQRFMERHAPVFVGLGPFYCVRYVDNRLLVCDADRAHCDVLQQLFSDNFYESPVELERVTSMTLWMLIKNFWALTLLHTVLVYIFFYEMSPGRFVFLTALARYIRSLQRLQLRKHSILRHVWPPEDRIDQLRLLTSMFCRAGYEPAQLR